MIELIKISGTPREMGQQYGEACSEKIRKSIDWWVAGVQLLSPEANKQQVISMGQKFVEPTSEYAPDLVDEMKGIAEGAKLSFEEIFFCNALAELILYPPMACTSFAVTGEATKDGETITGQNFDFWPGTELILLQSESITGLKSLSLSYPGTLGLLGINSAGIARQCNATVDYASPRIGVPTLGPVSQKVLQQKNLADALGAIFKAKRASSWNYLLASSEGDIIDVEATCDDISILYPENNFIVHTNHFLTDRFKSSDLIGLAFPDSYLRLDRMNKLMTEHYGEISVNLMKELLADHNDYPDSICRHRDADDPPGQQIVTLTSIICSPIQGKVYISAGNPCKTDYVEYRL